MSRETARAVMLSMACGGFVSTRRQIERLGVLAELDDEFRAQLVAARESRRRIDERNTTALREAGSKAGLW